MARLIELPPDYVRGGRYLAAAPSREEQFYKPPGLSAINMEVVDKIMTMAEKVGKSPLTGLAIKGIAKLYQMGQPSLADLQGQEANLRAALAAEGRTADDIEADVAELRAAGEELKKAYTDIPVPEAPDAPPPRPPAVQPQVGLGVPVVRPEGYTGVGIYAQQPPGVMTVPPPEGTPEPHPYWETTPVPGTTETVGQKRQRLDQEAYQHQVAAQEAEQARILSEQAQLGVDIKSREALLAEGLERRAQQQAQIAEVQAEIAEVPVVLGQQIESMDDLVRLAPTATQAERGELMAAARRFATPSNLFDFDYEDKAMKKIADLIVPESEAALSARRRELTRLSERETSAKELKAEATWLKANKGDALLELKGAKLEAQIAEIEGRLALNPEKLMLIQARIQAINDKRKYQNALLALKRANALAKSGGEKSKAFQNYKLHVLRSSKQDINSEQQIMRRAMEAMLIANAKVTPLDAKIARALTGGEKAKFEYEREKAVTAHARAKVIYDAQKLLVTSLVKIRNGVVDAKTLDEVSDALAGR